MAHYSMPVQQPFHSAINLPNLERKAEEFVAIHCIQTQTNYLCRDQPKTYFEDVMANHNGIMKPVIKDGGQGRIGPAAPPPFGRWAPGSTMQFFMNLL